LQMRQLRAAEAYRHSHKAARLRTLLLQSTQQVRYLFPHYGSAVVIGIPFRNPYGFEHCFTISWDDPLSHLSIISAVQEIQALKWQRSVAPSAEELTMQGRQLWLMPHEMVSIPFKFQAWQHGQVSLVANAPTQRPFDPEQFLQSAQAAASSAIVRRSILVNVLNAKAVEVASIDLRVRPQSYVVDQTFRFHQSENEFLKTTIRLQRARWHSTGPLTHLLETASFATHPPVLVPPPSANSYHSQRVWVRTSDSNVVAGVHEQRNPTDPVEISIKYKCAASPSVNRFLLLIYSDVWMHQLLETWEIIVHALQRIDLHALVGQTSSAKALLRGQLHSPQGLVQCFSSVPAELSLSPAAPFALTQNVNEVSLLLRPFAAGRKQYVVHAVDLSRHALLASWLVCSVTRFPAVTKVFSIIVHPALGAQKKVLLANPYTHEVAFRVHTDQPRLLQLKEPELLVPAGEARYISLTFPPFDGTHCTTTAATKLLVFINNEDDKNEECMQFAVSYVPHAPGSAR